MYKGGTFIRLLAALLITAALGAPASAQLGGLTPVPVLPPAPVVLPPAPVVSPPSWFSKLEPALQPRTSSLSGQSQVIVRAVNASSLSLVQQLIRAAGGTLGRQPALTRIGKAMRRSGFLIGQRHQTGKDRA